MNLNTTVHSKNFIENWKKSLIECYKYEKSMDFLVVKSLTGKKTLSYVPYLNYTDRIISDVDDLLELSKDISYQIRVINPDVDKFKDNDTVTMRLDISSHDLEEIFHKTIRSKCRNQIRKAEKSDFICKNGNTQKLLDDFYMIFSETMKRHGTPVFDKNFLESLNINLDVEFFVLYDQFRPIASLVMFYDDKIALNTWAGSNPEYLQYCPNHLIYWKAIQKAVQKKCDIFDFWRSGVNSSTYKFKKQWGAIPVKIDVLSDHTEQNIYSKYKFASFIWKNLPKKITDYSGPKLCKYLVDF